tara:strand:+ start:61087 stop:61767 length:681 start_codon:yes stop_codon:yes gene_type:complete
LNGPKVLVIDDDPSLLPILETYLGPFIQIDFVCEIQMDSLKKTISQSSHELILIDLDLGEISGLDILEEIRHEKHKLPENVILITAEGTIDDEIRTHELGIRDYIKKPFNKKLLKSIIEKHLSLLNQDSGSSIIKGPFRIDLQKFEIFTEDQKINLTLKEFKIFNLLFNNPNKIFSQSEIYERIWESESDSLLKTIDIHIGSIRKKLGPHADAIKNKRGVGYFFEL